MVQRHCFDLERPLFSNLAPKEDSHGWAHIKLNENSNGRVHGVIMIAYTSPSADLSSLLVGGVHLNGLSKSVITDYQ